MLVGLPLKQVKDVHLQAYLRIKIKKNVVKCLGKILLSRQYRRARNSSWPFIIGVRMRPVFASSVIYPTEIVRQLMALCLLIYISQYSVAGKVGLISPLVFLPLD